MNQLHTQPVSNPPALPRPMVNIALAFMAGIIYAKFFPVSLPSVLVIILLLIMAWFAWVKGANITKSNTHSAILFLLIGILGAGRMELQILAWKSASETVETIAAQGESILTGTVIGKKRYDHKNGYLVLNQVTAKTSQRTYSLPGKLECFAPSPVVENITLGDGIRFTGHLSPVRGPSIPSAFNEQEYLQSKNIHASVYLNKRSPVHLVETNTAPSIWGRGLAWESIKRIQNFVDASDEQQKIISLLASICFGIRGEMPIELKNRLQESGLAHITSISGLHVTFILYLLFWGCRTLRLKRNHAAFLTLFLSIFYLCLVGFRIPSIRAVLMAWVLLGQHIVQRKSDPMNSLGLAAFILLLISPNELFLASFQLSFMAVLILLLIAPYDQWLQTKISFQPLLWSIRGFASSLAVVIGLAPFTIHYFHLLSWGAVFGNVAAIPVLSLLLPLTYMWSISLFLPLQSIQEILEYVVIALSDALIAVIGFFSHPAFWFVLPSWSLYFSTIFLLVLLLILHPRRVLFQFGSVPIYRYQTALLLLAVFLFGSIAAKPYQPLRIDFLALGQGDCIFVHTPSGKTMLVDGGSPHYKKRKYRFSRLQEYLLSEGINRIDVMVLSHPQADHIGDFTNIAANFDIGLFLEGVEDSDSVSYKELRGVLKEKQINSIKVNWGDSFRLDSKTLCWILHPQTNATTQKDINEQSVVMIVESFGKRILLTGDIGFSTEKMLRSQLNNWDIDIMKVPHHGSRYSSSQLFLQETLPEFAIIQTGSNTYGHPHAESIKRLEKIKANVLRNDRDGTVRLTIFPQRYKVLTTRTNRIFQHIPNTN